MRIHPRYFIVRKAGLDISEAIITAAEKHELTPAEIVSILLEQTQFANKYCLRQERHGNMDKKADEE